jgi:phage-related protein
VPQTRVIFYCEADGTVPLLQWLDSLPEKVREKCLFRIRRLAALGHELRRPEADFLRDGIYELRVGLRGQNYRMLYFFHGAVAAVLSHGLTKEDRVPSKDIALAIRRKRLFEQEPRRHTYQTEL